ncbi:hypothetical protein ABW21_db0202438 [Orbilia brochopaga]|nr:hypothetical protein ABW21_db0202438 [Drechslerella brochopaga]
MGRARPTRTIKTTSFRFAFLVSFNFRIHFEQVFLHAFYHVCEVVFRIEQVRGWGGPQSRTRFQSRHIRSRFMRACRRREETRVHDLATDVGVCGRVFAVILFRLRLIAWICIPVYFHVQPIHWKTRFIGLFKSLCLKIKLVQRKKAIVNTAFQRFSMLSDLGTDVLSRTRCLLPGSRRLSIGRCRLDIIRRSPRFGGFLRTSLFH